MISKKKGGGGPFYSDSDRWMEWSIAGAARTEIMEEEEEETAFQGQYASSLRTTGPPPSAFLPASLPIPPTTVFSFGCSEKYIDT